LRCREKNGSICGGKTFKREMEEAISGTVRTLLLTRTVKYKGETGENKLLTPRWRPSVKKIKKSHHKRKKNGMRHVRETSTSVRGKKVGPEREK